MHRGDHPGQLGRYPCLLHPCHSAQQDPSESSGKMGSVPKRAPHGPLGPLGRPGAGELTGGHCGRRHYHLRHLGWDLRSDGCRSQVLRPDCGYRRRKFALRPGPRHVHRNRPGDGSSPFLRLRYSGRRRDSGPDHHAGAGGSPSGGHRPEGAPLRDLFLRLLGHHPTNGPHQLCGRGPRTVACYANRP